MSDNELMDKMLGRVKRLLERANHEATPKDEAESATAMAMGIMEKYRIDSAMLSTDVQREIAMMQIHVSPPFVQAIITLLNYLAEVFDCRLVCDSSAVGEAETFVVICGYKHDLEALDAITPLLTTQCVGEMISLPFDPTMNPMRFAEEFFAGYGMSVKKKFEAIRNGLSSETPGAELALRSRKQEVDDFFMEQFPETKSMEVSGGGLGVLFGIMAGERADIGQTRVENMDDQMVVKVVRELMG